jgi:hypothetical protein
MISATHEGSGVPVPADFFSRFIEHFGWGERGGA